MLFTRCPDCDTTFRITADALGKADGQVRCGRCACVFNAYSELREQRGGAMEAEQPATAERRVEDSDDIESEARVQSAPGESAEVDRSVAPEALEAASTEGAEEAEEAEEAEGNADARPSSSGEPPASSYRGGLPANGNIPMQSMAAPVPLQRATPSGQDISFGDFTVASIIEQIESNAVDEDGEEKLAASVTSALGDSAPFGKPLIESAVHHASRNPPSPSWELIAEPRVERISRRWLLGSIAAAALFALQVTHHFRAEIAGVAFVGPLLQGTYALFGGEVVPQWRLEQYEIVDWVATAEPNASGQGSLKITARIHNNGPQAQPFPHVQVQLNDRWEERIGHRIFKPSEYLNDPALPSSLMAPGAIARAELEVIDPGPEAYGFELDLCVQSEAKTLRCSADAVFSSM